MNDKSWHAVYVNSRSEKKVGESLHSQYIECYVPLVKTMRQWSDRKKLVEMPLLSGYVFVKNTPAQNDKILQTKGVVSFVRSEGKIAEIKDYEIERLKQVVSLGYHIEAEAINRKYNEGEKVKITSGALSGVEGFVVDIKANRHIEILLESIGQCIRVKLPQEILIPA